MNELIKSNHYMTLTSKQRKQELLEALRAQQFAIKQAAQIFVACEESGDDVSFVPSHIAKRLRIVAGQKALPEVYHLNASIADKLAKLPIAKQQTLIDGEKIKIVKGENQKGQEIIAQKTVRELSPDEARLVFSDTGIRPLHEQQSELKKIQKLRRDREAAQKSSLSVTLDQVRHGAYINGTFIHVGQLQDIVQSLNA